MTPRLAVLDACVLYPAPLRDFLMNLAISGLFRARWTTRIHEEWTRNLRANRPEITQEKLAHLCELMNGAILDSVVTGYEPLEAGIALPDPDDRHVVAAAVRVGAPVIVTFNGNDFPAKVLEPLGIEAQDPDTFAVHLFDLSREGVCSAANKHRASLRKPPKLIDEYLDTLKKQGLPRIADCLGENRHLL